VKKEDIAKELITLLYGEKTAKTVSKVIVNKQSAEHTQLVEVNIHYVGKINFSYGDEYLDDDHRILLATHGGVFHIQLNDAPPVLIEKEVKGSIKDYHLKIDALVKKLL
jgi:hypothetical protein